MTTLLDSSEQQAPIKVVRIIGGEMFIGRVTEEDGTTRITDCYVIGVSPTRNPGQLNIGFGPMFAPFSDDTELEIKSSLVLKVLEAPEEVTNMYRSFVSGLTIPDQKKIILG